MSAKNAEDFVNRLRQDKEFRKKMCAMTDTGSAKKLLTSEGLDFNEFELMCAMISCMNGMDAVMGKGGACCS